MTKERELKKELDENICLATNALCGATVKWINDWCVVKSMEEQIMKCPIDAEGLPDMKNYVLKFQRRMEWLETTYPKLKEVTELLRKEDPK